MAFLRPSLFATVALVSGAVVTSAGSARALQPLEAFLSGAKEHNADVRVAKAMTEQRDAEVDYATGGLLPSLTARGIYTRNQFDSTVPKKYLDPGFDPTIPTDQVDGYARLSVPLVDIGAWERRSAAKAGWQAAIAEQNATENEVERAVTRRYYQLLADESVLRAAKRNLEVSQQNIQIARTRKQGGTASVLDVQRSTASMALSQQDVAAASLAVATGRRSLETLTGVSPEEAATFPMDDLHEEGPLSTWTGSIEKIPAVMSAAAAAEAADANASAATANWLPTVAANAQEHVTNAPGFALHGAYYALDITATWRLDAQIPANQRAQRAAADAAVARADKAKRLAEDAIYEDWYQVRASIDRARAARAQLAAATSAADLTRDRFGGGMQTELEVLQSQQEAFRADVARIEADADLAYARAALRLDSASMSRENHE
jgi:outer membrane protein TolC